MGASTQQRLKGVDLEKRWREKIRASALINRLRNHVFGRVEMSATQLKAAEILLRKALPDLQSVAHEGEITHRYVAELPEVPNTVEEWQKRYSPPAITTAPH